MFDIPVLLVVYNRADTAEKVLDAIAEVKPERLFIASNAPNPDKPGDAEKVSAVRLIIKEKITWPCKTEWLLRTDHLTAGRSLSSSMIWFFKAVEEGIVFEDDTLPAKSFFTYCKELLAYYRNDESVKMIGGNNFQNGKMRGDGSYYFSGYTHSWGYASWWRAWQDYDLSLNQYNETSFKELLDKRFDKEDEKNHWWNVYQNFRAGNYDTWDFQFLFNMWEKKGKCIIPNKNLVSNIGFGNNATHTTNANDPAANRPLEQIHQIIHPSTAQISVKADRFFYSNYLKGESKLRRKLKRVVRTLIGLK